MHGSPLDEDEYVIGAAKAGQAFGYMESRVADFSGTRMCRAASSGTNRAWKPSMRMPRAPEPADAGNRSRRART